MTQVVTSVHVESSASETVQNLSGEIELAIGWKAILFLLASIPFLHAAVTWDWDGQLSGLNHALRHYSLPVVWLELAILLLSARIGWRPVQQFLHLPKSVRWTCAILCVSVIITSVFVSISPAMSALFTIRYAVHGLLIGALIFLLSKGRLQLSDWITPLLTGIALYLAALVVFCLLVPDPSNFPWSQRLPSATNIRQIANVLGLMALAPATLLFFERSPHRLLIAVSLLTALLAFIMCSGSRGALLGFGVAVVCAGWLSRKALTTGRVTLFLFSCGIALVLSLLFPIPDPMFGMVRIAESVVSSEPSSGRLQVWQSALEAIKTNPFFGHGAGTYRANMEPLTGQPFNHPHNFILQFVYDWGLVGGGLALGLLAWSGLTILKSDKGMTEERFLSSSAIAGIVTMAMIDGALFYPLPIIIAIALIAPHLVRH